MAFKINIKNRDINSRFTFKETSDVWRQGDLIFEDVFRRNKPTFLEFVLDIDALTQQDYNFIRQKVGLNNNEEINTDLLSVEIIFSSAILSHYIDSPQEQVNFPNASSDTYFSGSYINPFTLFSHLLRRRITPDRVVEQVIPEEEVYTGFLYNDSNGSFDVPIPINFSTGNRNNISSSVTNKNIVRLDFSDERLYFFPWIPDSAAQFIQYRDQEKELFLNVVQRFNLVPYFSVNYNGNFIGNYGGTNQMLNFGLISSVEPVSVNNRVSIRRLSNYNFDINTLTTIDKPSRFRELFNHRYIANGLPQGLTINEGTGVISGNITDETGNYNTTIIIQESLINLDGEEEFVDICRFNLLFEVLSENTLGIQKNYNQVPISHVLQTDTPYEDNYSIKEYTKVWLRGNINPENVPVENRFTGVGLDLRGLVYNPNTKSFMNFTSVSEEITEVNVTVNEDDLVLNTNTFELNNQQSGTNNSVLSSNQNNLTN